MYVSCIILKTTSTIVMWLNFDHGRNAFMLDNSVMWVKNCHFMWVINFICICDIWYMYEADDCLMVCIVIYVKYICFVLCDFCVVFLHVGSYAWGYCSRRGWWLSEYGRYISLLILSHFSVENCCNCFMSFLTAKFHECRNFCICNCS